MKTQTAAEENNAYFSESEKARAERPAQPMSLTDAEELLKRLANVFFFGGSTPQARAESVAEELPDVEAGYRTLVEQIPAVVFMASLDKGIGEAYVGHRGESAGMNLSLVEKEEDVHGKQWV